MIESLNIPPILTTTVPDTVAGDVQVRQAASAVRLSSGTLELGDTFARSPGTLVNTLLAIEGSDPFDATDYAIRDRQLAGRDLAVAAAVVVVNAQITSVWGASAQSPTLPLPVWPELPDDVVDYPTDFSPAGTIEHVKPSSRPIDAVIADKDLYARDMLLFEALARGSSILQNPPIARIDPYGTLLSTIPVEWSLGQAVEQRTTISVNDRLDVDCFMRPDGFLAFRDNTNGVYVSRVLSWLKNPFENAERLYLSITGVESEVYVHDKSQDTDDYRIFVTDLGLEGRLKLVYDKNLQTVRWLPLSSSEIHVPQPQPFVTGGTTVDGPPGRTITFEPITPPQPTLGYWYQKALQVSTVPQKVLSEIVLSGAGANGSDLDGRVNSVSILANSSTLFDTIGTLPSGTLLVGLAVTPRAYQEYLGCQVNELTAADEGGDGLFPAVGGLATILGVRLPPDSYQLVIEYTNASGTAPDEFPISISFGSDVITTSPWRFAVDGHENGDWVSVVYNVVSDDTEKDLLIQWAPPDNLSVLSIKSIRFSTVPVEDPYINLSATLKSGALVVGTARFEMATRLSRPDVAIFSFPVASAIINPGVHVDLESTGLVAVAVNQVQVSKETAQTITPNAAGFESWPDKMLTRAADILLSQYRQAAFTIDRRETDTDETLIWTARSMDLWIDDLRTLDGRFNEAFQLAGPCDIGHPAIIPNGLQFDVATERIVATLGPAEGEPTIQALQPWMLSVRPYVAKHGFWTE